MVEIANKFETGEESTKTFFNDYVNEDDDTEEDEDSTEDLPLIIDNESDNIELHDVKKDIIDDFEYL